MSVDYRGVVSEVSDVPVRLAEVIAGLEGQHRANQDEMAVAVADTIEQQIHDEASALKRIYGESDENSAGDLRRRVFGRIDEILATGLHAYLTQFLDRVNDLGAGIGRDFLVPVAA